VLVSRPTPKIIIPQKKKFIDGNGDWGLGI